MNMENLELLYSGQEYLLLIIFIMLNAGMIKDFDLFLDVFTFFKNNLKSNKAIVAVVSLFSGLLPIKGRVTVSAGLLDTLAPDKGKSGREKYGPIDYVSTHHYYMWSPLEKTVILPMATFGITYAMWFNIMWPLIAVTAAFIITYLVFFVKESEVQIKEYDGTVKVSKITRYVFPYIIAIAAVVAGVNFVWSFGLLTLYYMIVTQTFDARKLISYIDFKLLFWISLIIICSNFAITYTNDIKEYLKEFHLDINTNQGFISVSALAFISSFLLGSSSRFAAITVLLTSLYGIQYLPWFFAIDFAGYLLSPMHKCVAIGMLYFNTKFSYYSKVLVTWGLIVIFTSYFLI